MIKVRIKGWNSSKIDKLISPSVQTHPAGSSNNFVGQQETETFYMPCLYLCQPLLTFPILAEQLQ